VLNRVVVSKSAQRDIRKAPVQIRGKLALWVTSVETVGIETVRKVPGYHDEPLRGRRAGQRSIRLSRQWRAIYVILNDAHVEFVEIQEVNPHAY
jgi:proteic killer suppression protein